ncbi:branched-chain amino acid ABC transporter permease [Noviherbaspirillum sp.]|uniref:branched-chain amino acid ABC transporter permease n=1 Tax=Noviherbaspirillum sp. TaxID=1926288 RepID=UPI002B46FCFF|nr:branched-chain amino acid ABC transporter permease [Noviherbaspirillum sp.]HJV82069.1 branched-chain amino acid ABC transporter permease [Noviherbaspirillum sp.]
MRNKYTSHLLILALIAMAAAAPLFASDYMARLLAVAAISIVAVLGMNIVFGYAGLISLGHAAFLGMGSYGVAILTVRHGLGPWTAAVIAIAVTAVVAYAIGRLVLRLKGHYLALATLGLNVSFTIVTSNWIAFTGGSDGIANIPALSLAGWTITTERDFYWFALTVVVLLAMAEWRLRHSHAGRAFMAVRDDEIAAAMTGIAVTRAKTAAFTMGAVYAGIAGCLFAFHVRFVSPDDFAYHHSITHLAMLIVGGEGAIGGAILGAVAVTMLPEVLRSAGNAYLLIFGVLVLLVLVLLPKGLVSLLERRKRPEAARELPAIGTMEVKQ